MRGRGMCIAAFAVVCLGGCGSTHASRGIVHGRLTGGEIRWIRGYGVWRQRLRNDVNLAERTRAELLQGHRSLSAFTRAVRRVSTCYSRYVANVGRAPTGRLRAAARLSVTSCRGFARGEQLLLRAESSPDLIFAGTSRVEHAREGLYLANERFYRLFRWNRALPRAGGTSRRSRTEPLFSRVASAVAKRPVEIRCWSGVEWESVLEEFRAWSPGVDPGGFIDPSLARDRANLEPYTCRLLVRLAYRREYPRGGLEQLEMAAAVQLLSHEVQHLVGLTSEAATECLGVQRIERVARGLGAPPAYARDLAVRYWADGYPDNPPAYRTRLCHDGGPFDAHPNSSRWP